MAYSLIAQSQGRIEEAEISIAPTIVIGIGGTGQQILLRLRRRFLEKYGNLGEYPIVGYCYIDTDTHDEEQNDLARGNDLLMYKIRFEPNEKVNVNVNVADYIGKIDHHPRIKSWLNTTGDLANLGDLHDGAGQIRPASRLGFFDKFDGIKNVLGTIQRDITSVEAKRRMSETHKIDIDPNRFNIYVCFSLAGGTGSGVFLDLAYLLKDMFPNATRVGFAVLSTVYVNYGSRTLANGYAALKELNHYKFHNQFAPAWTEQYINKDYPPPPFDYCYLIDGENESGASITPATIKDLYGVVADNIFQDFAHSTFAGYKRAVKINLVQYLADLYAYKHKNSLGDEVLNETFPCRYSSFGMSMISYPVERIKNACAYKLAGEIIDHWGTQLTGEDSIRIDKTIFEEVLPDIGFLEGTVQKAPSPIDHYDVVDALNRFDESGAAFDHVIENWVDTLEKNVLDAKPSSWRNYVLEEQEKYDQNFRGADTVDAGKWGDYLKIMEDNKKRLLQNVTKELEKVIGDIANDPQRGIGYSLSCLRRLKEILADKVFRYLPRFKAEQQEMAAKVAELNNALATEINELMIIENRMVKFHKEAAKEHQLRERIVPLLKNYYRFRMKVRARKLAIEACEELLKFIGDEADPDRDIQDSGLVLKYKKLLESVQQLHDHCAAMYKFFKTKQHSPLVLNVYEEGELDKKYYAKYMGEPDSEAHQLALSNHSIELLNQIGINNVHQLIYDISREGVTKVGERILKYTRSVFNRIDSDFNILDLFYRKHGHEAKNVIRQFASYGKAWFKGSDVGGGFRLPIDKRKFYVGLPQRENDPNYDEFRQTLKNVVAANDPQPEFRNSANNAEIAFYTENVGFPAFYLHSIYDYRGKYNEWLKEGKDLHIDKNQYRFKDLIPLDDKERDRLVQTHKAFLLGAILGVFNVESFELDYKTKVALYRFEQERAGGFKQMLTLGEEGKALDYIFHFEGHPPLYEQILARVYDRKEEVKKATRLPEYAALLRYYLEEIYKIEEVAISGGAKQKVSSLESDLLLEELKEIDDLVKEYSQENKQNFATARENNLGELKQRKAQFAKSIGDRNKLALTF